MTKLRDDQMGFAEAASMMRKALEKMETLEGEVQRLSTDMAALREDNAKSQTMINEENEAAAFAQANADAEEEDEETEEENEDEDDDA